MRCTTNAKVQAAANHRAFALASPNDTAAPTVLTGGFLEDLVVWLGLQLELEYRHRI